jgi:hypothetical protein
MAEPLCELLGCELPIQLAPMGSVSATPSLPLDDRTRAIAELPAARALIA